MGTSFSEHISRQAGKKIDGQKSFKLNHQIRVMDRENEVTKLLKEISAKLDAISEGIRKINSDDNKRRDRDFQIKLAKLQTDVQIWLALGLGMVAACGGILVGGYQLYITSVSPDMLLVKYALYATLSVLLFAFAYLAKYCSRRMTQFRDEMDKLQA